MATDKTPKDDALAAMGKATELIPVHAKKLEVSKGDGLGTLTDVDEGRRRLDAFSTPVDDPLSAEALARIKARAWEAPADYRFDRDEANES